MDIKEKLAGLVSAKPAAVQLAYTDEYIEKLASACEYAAKNIAPVITHDTPVPVGTGYVRTELPREKVAHAVSQPGETPGAFLARGLREKVALRTAAFGDAEREATRGVVQNILGRLLAGRETPAQTSTIVDSLPQTGTSVEDLDGPAVELEAPAEVQDLHASETVEAVAAVPSSSLADVLAAATRQVQVADGTSESTVPATATKTAGARGKGPMAIGEATNRLRGKLLSHAGGNVAN